MSNDQMNTDPIDAAIGRAEAANQPIAVLNVQFMPNGEPVMRSVGKLTSWNIYALRGLLGHLGDGLFSAEVQQAQQADPKSRLVVAR